MSNDLLDRYNILEQQRSDLQAQVTNAEQHRKKSQERVDSAHSLFADLFTEDIHARLATELANASNTLTALKSQLASVASQIKTLRTSMGEEFLDTLRELHETVSDLLASPDIRGSNELRAIALEDMLVKLQEARGLNTILTELTASPETAQSPEPSSYPVAPELPASPLQAVRTPTPSSYEVDVGLPLELSEYIYNTKSGSSLKDFATRYAPELKKLLAMYHGDLEQVTRYLNQRGLNGGLMNVSTLRAMYGNAGLSIVPERYTLSGPQGEVVKAASALEAARKYLMEVLGLESIYEQAPLRALFGRNFRITKAAPGQYNLHLLEQTPKQLKELLHKLSRGLGVMGPTWLDNPR